MVVEMKKTQREAELVAARRAIEKVALKEHKTVGSPHRHDRSYDRGLQ